MKAKLKLFTCTDHDGHWPTGAASIVIAKDRRQAKKLLDAELEADGLKPFKQKSYTLTEVLTTKPHAIILYNGDY